MKTKTKTNIKPASRLTSDSQSRLVAYTAAAGLGAFFGGQTVEGQVTESPSYPTYLGPGQGTGYQNDFFYLDIDGDGTNDFVVSAGSVVHISGTSPGNILIDRNVSGYNGGTYLYHWTNGVTINATTSSRVSAGFLALARRYPYFDDFYPGDPGYAGPLPYYLGFSFTSGDGKTHFGYMNIQVIPQDFWFGTLFHTIVNGIYYNQTPNAAIVTGSLPPVIVSATSIQVGAQNAVTINFTSSDNAAASAFTLETSPVLGASASWTTDTKAVISSSGPGVYQAVTTGTGGPSQFFRIKP